MAIQLGKRLQPSAAGQTIKRLIHVRVKAPVPQQTDFAALNSLCQRVGSQLKSWFR